MRFIFSVLLLLIVVGLFVGVGKNNTAPATAESLTEVAQPAAPIGERLDDALALIAAFDTSSFTVSVDRVGIALGLLNSWATLVDESARVPADDQLGAKRKKLMAALSKLQKLALPVLRDRYGPLVRSRLWENDITAHTIGAGFRTIDLVGGTFAANRNIKMVNDTLYPSLMRLRFTRSQYRWYEGADQYTYFTLTPPADGDIAVFSESGAFRVIK